VHDHAALDDAAHAREHAIPGTAPLTFRSAVLAAASGNVAPCPAALVVLLAAIALHQVAYGMVLIVAVSIGVAAVLTVLGIAVVRSAAWLVSRPRFDRAARWAPLLTALVIATVGAVMVGQGFVAQGLAVPVPLVAALILAAVVGYAFAWHRHVGGTRMIGPGAFTVFVLGMRHGADPDHLAAIDNVTRNAYAKTPLLSRFVGTFFAGGHTVMVLAISALVGLLGAHFAAHGALIETVGTWISIVVLLLVAALNVRALRSGDSRLAGAKTRLLPKRLREGSSALVAIPIGLLFGFGFETSSQLAAYAVAFGADAGLAGALIVGAMFSAGMICTDTMDSLLVHRLISYRSDRLPALMRVWILSVTILAVVVAVYEMAQLFGWRSPLSDLAVSAVLVTSLVLVFAYVFVRTRRAATEAPPAAAAILGEHP